MLKNIKHNESFIKLFSFLGGMVNHLIAKKKRIVLYSNWGFRDNVRYLYDYLIDNSYDKEYEIICASNDFYGLDEIASKNIIFIKSKVKILKYFLTSKYFFYCFGGIPIRSARGQKVINLWHGMPIKKIGRLESGMSRDLNYFDYLLSYSDFFSSVLQQSFDINPSKIMIANAPRNEPFIKIDTRRVNNRKTIAWLPTYRKSTKLASSNGDSDEIIPLFSDSKDFESFDDFLGTKNICMYIKLHPLQDTINIPRNLKNITFINDTWLFERNTDLYKFLARTDALITDYSSISIDYLLLDRPIFYVMNDRESYSNSRGFNFTINQFVAGEIVENMNQFKKAISDFSANKDEFITLRHGKLNDFYANGSSGIKELLDFVGI
ncbi:teichoic acid biosynthesis protein [Lactobacillus sp. CBA3606]|uniref:CDP-glycerol glycerophosphotransferase family protein n=1 Tax=Lactobacillus sp. CBA3606 TaxID=2099789 RepID=UPI000CFD2F22|nr:CDP-glycerol glycerophosphotransferase family protein [Lactobacillus sp. CBA3606]AVK62718.1 teichoic acid biosynthesis protein [Lactobacillus sp. CBA3606]